MTATPDEPAGIVRRFFESMQERDWDAAEACLSPTIRIEFTETGEVFDGPNFLGMNRAYPDGWTIEVVEVIAVDDRVAAQVRVDLPPETFWCAGFYTVTGGVILDGVEHWVTAGSATPPGWRAPFRSRER